MNTNSRPLAVLISDVHYSLTTLPLADTAMRQAITKTNELKVTLVVAGDLHDTKANLRGECVNAMIETFKLCERPPIVLIGNHDRLNEKAPAHSLNFLAPYAMIVDQPKYIHPIGHFIPYQHDPQAALYAMPNKGIVIMHQGLTNTNSGDYIQDKSAIQQVDIEGLRIISGHYHTRQTIQLPNGGIWDYLGNPYTLNYAEANDPEKGFQILYADGSLEFVPTNLRKHIVIQHDLDTDESHWSSGPIMAGNGIYDLVRAKLSGRKETLSKFNKTAWCREKGLPQYIRIDLIPTDTTTQAAPQLSQGPLLDALIDSLTATSDERKVRLKDLWKAL